MRTILKPWHCFERQGAKRKKRAWISRDFFLFVIKFKVIVIVIVVVIVVVVFQFLCSVGAVIVVVVVVVVAVVVIIVIVGLYQLTPLSQILHLSFFSSFDFSREISINCSCKKLLSFFFFRLSF